VIHDHTLGCGRSFEVAETVGTEHAELVQERERRRQAEARALAAERRAQAAEERALSAEWKAALLRNELAGGRAARRQSCHVPHLVH
jgi:hypothetical protein